MHALHYNYVYRCYTTPLRWQVQRFNPNSDGITDEELLPSTSIAQPSTRRPKSNRCTPIFANTSPDNFLKSLFINSLHGDRRNQVEYRDYIGDKATVTRTIPANGEGRIFYRGTEWTAVSDNQVAIEKGNQIIIKRMNGIIAIVTPI